MIFFIILLSILGLMLFILLKPKPAGDSQIVRTANHKTNDTIQQSYSEARKND